MKDRMTYIDLDLLVSPSQSDERVRVFQRKLYIAAKKEKSYKAYSLYDKVCTDYLLVTAYHACKAKQLQGNRSRWY